MGRFEFLLSYSMKLFSLFPVRKNRIVFQSFYGTAYNDNPKSLSDYLKDKGLELIWIVKNKDHYCDEGVRFVSAHSLRCLYYLSTAKVWIDNCRKQIWIRKRNNQYYIQTWHAGISNKLGERLAENSLSSKYIAAAKHDSDMADLFLSNSKWLSNSYRDSFWYNGKILEAGLPREDILVSNRAIYHSQVCSFYGLDENTHIIIYAPTFRQSQSLSAYNIDYNKVIKLLSSKGDKWAIIVRLHPSARGENKLVYNEFVLDGTLYSEINELIMASDILISDYSSCLFDAMLAGCQVLIYASDIDQYIHERGFAFSWEELPFPLTKNNEELCEALSNFDMNKYLLDVNRFKEKCGVVKLGNATQKVSEYILQVISNG